MNRSLIRATLQEVITSIRPQLEHALCFFTGKGGVGKTTCTSNCGATMAHVLAQSGSDRRVLCVELDGQGNMGLDLGYAQGEGDDDGKSILDVVMGTGELNVIRDVRPHLDVVPGGSQILKIGRYLTTLRPAERNAAMLRFAKALADLGHIYDWIFIDVPPIDQDVQVLGLTAARWVVIPAAFDRASRFGLEGVDQAFDEASELNPDLDVLGVLLFAFDRRELRRVPGTDDEVKEVGQRARVRQRITEMMHEIEVDAPVLDTVISNARTVAEEARELGMVAYELADAAADPEWRKQRRTEGSPVIGGDAAEALAADYEDLVVELVNRAKERAAA